MFRDPVDSFYVMVECRTSNVEVPVEEASGNHVSMISRIAAIEIQRIGPSHK